MPTKKGGWGNVKHTVRRNFFIIPHIDIINYYIYTTNMNKRVYIEMDVNYDDVYTWEPYTYRRDLSGLSDVYIHIKTGRCLTVDYESVNKVRNESIPIDFMEPLKIINKHILK